uniref:NADH-ubiquinone oxidoreductase chain 6 n=1 Tax=Moloha majora TaxID=405146 RepID=A0A0X9LU35_9EUCA|nr:NADH dehydrogenase subunit 6 [Moloha majora]ALZ50231.1 NADH dehydrogenase subunit 6 [Moloha majora]
MSLLMMPIMMTLSIMFTRMNHPLSMGLTLLLQTIFICITSGLSSSSFWFSYILFLIFLGGMMVLFIYVASLASNTKFKFPFLSMFIIFSLLTISMVILFFMDLMDFPTSNNIAVPSTLLMSYQNKTMLINWIYSPKLIMFTLFIVLYLLLTLLVVVKISYSHMGPMRLSS